MNGIDPVGSIANAVALGVLINALALATAILGATAPVAAGATAALGPLLAVFAALTVIVAAAGALAAAGAGGIIDQAAGILTSIGEALGGFVGGIVAGFSEAVISVIPKIGQALADFGTNVQPFLDTMSNIDPSVGEGISTLAGALLTLTGAGFLDSLTKLLSGGIFGKSGLEQMVTQMPLLGEAFAGFAENLDGVDLEAATTGAKAVKTIADALAQVPSEGGLLGAILGGKDYAKFGEGMGALGEGLVAFDDATKGMTDLDTISTRVNAMKTIMEGMSNVPSTDGWIQQVFGQQNWQYFADGMGQMGSGLVAFNDATQSLTPELLESITQRTNALSNVINAMKNIPSSDGWAQDVFGEQNWSGFANGMDYIGQGLRRFATATASIEDLERLNTLTTPLTAVITAMSKIPMSGGILNGLLGKEEIDFDGFGDGMASIGTGLQELYNNCGEIEDATRLVNFAQAVKTIFTALNGITTNAGTVMGSLVSGTNPFGEAFTTAMGNLGSGIAVFAVSTTSTNFDNVGNAVNAAQKIYDLLAQMNEFEVTGVNNFKEAIDTLADVNISGFVETFSQASGDFESIGTNILSAVSDAFTGDALNDGVSTVISGMISTFEGHAADYQSVATTICSTIADAISDDTNVSDAAEDLINSAQSAASSATDGFASVGSNIGAGIVAGMNDWIEPICSKAAQLVYAAKDAANEAANSNSPSKVFRYEVAGYMGWGMVVGLEDYESKVGRAGGNLARSAIDGVKSTISRIGDVFNSDLDVNPTIRPVLDLSDVRSGADSINGMFDSLVPMDVLGRVNSISRSMDSRIQNGSFNDVVSAIDKLRTNLSELGGTTYNVNGITYDDGTNVANAVNDLTRAIRLERRV